MCVQKLTTKRFHPLEWLADTYLSGKLEKVHTYLRQAPAKMSSLKNELFQSAVLGLQDFTRLMFNFLRVSPTYSLVAQQAGSIRLRKHMPGDQRAAIHCFRRYGDVYGQSFDSWSHQHARLWTQPVRQPVAVYSGPERRRIQDQDTFVHLPRDCDLPSAKEWHGLLTEHRARQRLAIIADKAKIRLSSLWKILHLVYTRAMHPDVEQWRVGAMVKLVKDFANDLDPWAARSKRGVEDMRRHMNLMVRRWLDRGAVIAANAVRGLFPSDVGSTSVPENWQQIRFDFEDDRYIQQLFAQGQEEFDFASARVAGS